MSQAKELVINIDGACKGNPGPASIGAVIRSKDGEVLKELSEPIGNTTNNVAEYFSLIFALQEAAVMGASKVSVKTDSQLMARQYNGEYRVKEPHVKLLQRLVQRLKGYFEECLVVHIPREENKEADKLANRAFDQFFL